MIEDLFRWATEMQSFDALPLLLKVTLIACIGRLLIAALPRATAAVRFGIAMMTLAGALVLPLVMATPVRIALPVLDGVKASPPVRVNDDSRRRLSFSDIEVVARALPAPVAQPLALSQRILATWRGWLLLIYAGMAVIASARLLLGIATLRRVIANATVVDDEAITGELRIVAESLGIARAPLVLVSDRADVPVMWGLTKPVLILPASGLQWSAERLRVVFLHELAHWNRRDVVALLLMRLATAIYWFHPVVWSLERIARRDCERACDDVVLANGTRASEYADHLLAIARGMPRTEPFGEVTVAMSRPAELEGRLVAILHNRIKRGAMSLPMYGALAAAMLAITIPLGAAHLTYTASDVRLGVIRGIAGGVKGGVTGGVDGGIAGGIEGGVDGGVKGGVPDGVKFAVEDWYERGKRDLRARHLGNAIEEFSNVIRADPFHGAARYNLACAYALRGDSKLALQTLREAVLNNFSDPKHMLEDDDLVSIRGPQMDAIAALAEGLVIANPGSDWQSAIPRYERFANAHPDIPRAWFNLGFVLSAAHEDHRAIDIYKQRVLAAGYRPATAMYNIACAYAHLNERENALQWLRQAQASGFDVGASAATDSDLDPVRKDPWLASLIAEKAQKHKDKFNKDKDKDKDK